MTPAGTVLIEIDIEAPPEAVFAALTDPAQLEAWWGSDEIYKTFDWRVDLRVGGSWSCRARSATGEESTVHGVFTDIEPPRVLAYTWNPSWDAIPETSVRYLLESTPAGGTRLQLTHTGFAGADQQRAGHEQGWHLVFGWLRGHTSKE